MAELPSDTPVIVAVRDVAEGKQLVRTACDIARLGSAEVLVVTVAVKPRASPFSIFADETIIEEYAGDSRAILEATEEIAPPGVSVNREIVVGQTVAHGITQAVEETGAQTVVTGWRERTRRDAVLGSNIDRLLERLPADLYVERIGTEANGVDSILVPVAGGPHVRPAILAAKGIAARNDASVEILSVAAGEIDISTASEYAAEAEVSFSELGGPSVPVDAHVIEVDRIADGIIETLADHDIVIFGSTRRSALRRRLVGSIPREVASLTDRTVILARAGETVATQPFRLNRLLRAFR